MTATVTITATYIWKFASDTSLITSRNGRVVIVYKAYLITGHALYVYTIYNLYRPVFVVKYSGKSIWEAMTAIYDYDRIIIISSKALFYL